MQRRSAGLYHKVGLQSRSLYQFLLGIGKDQSLVGIVGDQLNQHSRLDCSCINRRVVQGFVLQFLFMSCNPTAAERVRRTPAKIIAFRYMNKRIVWNCLGMATQNLTTVENSTWTRELCGIVWEWQLRISPLWRTLHEQENCVGLFGNGNSKSHHCGEPATKTPAAKIHP